MTRSAISASRAVATAATSSGAAVISTYSSTRSSPPSAAGVTEKEAIGEYDWPASSRIRCTIRAETTSDATSASTWLATDAATRVLYRRSSVAVSPVPASISSTTTPSGGGGVIISAGSTPEPVPGSVPRYSRASSATASTSMSPEIVKVQPVALPNPAVHARMIPSASIDAMSAARSTSAKRSSSP